MQKIKTRYSESSPEVIAQVHYVVVFVFTRVFSMLTGPRTLWCCSCLARLLKSRIWLPYPARTEHEPFYFGARRNPVFR